MHSTVIFIYINNKDLFRHLYSYQYFFLFFYLRYEDILIYMILYIYRIESYVHLTHYIPNQNM